MNKVTCKSAWLIKRKAKRRFKMKMVTKKLMLNEPYVPTVALQHELHMDQSHGAYEAMRMMDLIYLIIVIIHQFLPSRVYMKTSLINKLVL